MSKQLSLIILTYNSEKDIYDCLSSVYKYNDIGDGLEIIVVDNNSANFDTMRSKLQQQYPDVIIIRNKKNGGYGQGNNVGIRASTAPIVTVMNPDVRLIMPVFGTILHTLQKTNIVLCGGKQYTTPDKVGYSFWYDFMAPAFYHAVCWPIRRRLDWFNSNKMWLSGAFFAIRKDIFLSIGLFDENIFMYCEENDIARRIHIKYPNARMQYLPRVHYLHCIEERVFSTKSVDRQLGAELYLCKKFHIPIKDFIQRERHKIKMRRWVSFLRTGNTDYSSYQTYKLSILKRISHQ